MAAMPIAAMIGTDEAPAAARSAGLRYVSDQSPGIRRRKRGRGFSYVRPDGMPVTDPTERGRIEAIVIPPAWTDVWISPHADGHILATGRDAKGRKQYRYHPRWREVRDATKYERLADFGAMLPDLRAEVAAELRRPGLPLDKVLALVVRLLDESLIRVGNDEYAVSNESYGLTTLRPEHVEVDAARLEFEFVGKGGLTRRVTLEDRQLARLVRQCHELGGQELFGYLDEEGRAADVGSTDVNDYLRRLTGEDVTAKDFRTWGGTTVAAASLAVSRPARTERQAEQQILSAIDVAAEVLGNTRTVCRNCYVHPVVPEAYRGGELHERWRTAREAGRLARAERTVLALLRDHLP